MISTSSYLNHFSPSLMPAKSAEPDRLSVAAPTVFRPLICRESVSGDLTEQLVQIGSKVKVRWLSDDSGWRAGWYEATVHKYQTSSLSRTQLNQECLTMKSLHHWLPTKKSNLYPIWSPLKHKASY